MAKSALGQSRKAQREQMFRRRGSYTRNSVISDGGEATMEELNGFRFFILAGESVDTLWIDQVMLFRSADRIIRAESQTTAALTASNAAKISRNIDI